MAGSLCNLLVLLCAVMTASSAMAQPTDIRGTCSRTERLTMQRLASLEMGATGGGAVEVVSYCPSTRMAAVVMSSTNTLAIVDMATPSMPTIARRILVGAAANETGVGAPNSAAARNGIVAVSLDAAPKTDPGFVRLYDMRTGAMLASMRVPGCSIPDMVTWTHDGKRLVVACEAEPYAQDDGDVGSDPTIEPNPEGGIAVLTVTRRGSRYTLQAKVLGFQRYINSLSSKAYASLLSRGMLIDPRLTKAQAGKDIEPEYIALSDHGLYAYVTLQENNAIARIRLTPAGKEAIDAIWPLGYKSWSNFGLDPSDRDSRTELRKYANVRALYQPDTIRYATIGGRGYLFTANEGDAKEERVQVKDIPLDPVAFPNATGLQTNAELGRLGVSPFCGLKNPYNASLPWNKQGPYSALCTYGARSFAIWDARNGQRVYDSGDFIERTALADPQAKLCFNCNNGSGGKNEPDNRSDNAGPEPEAIEVAQINNRWYAWVGLERQGGMMLFDVTDVRRPAFQRYYYYRNFTASATGYAALGDVAPEGIIFVKASESATRRPLIIATNEQSGTLAVYGARTCP